VTFRFQIDSTGRPRTNLLQSRCNEFPQHTGRHCLFALAFASATPKRGFSADIRQLHRCAWLVTRRLHPADQAGTRPLRFAGTILRYLVFGPWPLGLSGRRRVFHRPSLITRMVSALRGPQNITLQAAMLEGMSIVGGVG